MTDGASSDIPPDEMTSTEIASDEITWTTAVLRRHTPLFLSFHITGQTPESIRRHTGIPAGFTHLRRSGLALQYSQAEQSAARSIIHHQAANLGFPFFEDFSGLCLSSCETLLQAAEKAGAQIPRQQVPPHQARSQVPAQSGDAPALAAPALEAILQPYFDAAIAQASLLSTMVMVQRELEAFLDRFVATRIADDRKAAAVSAALKMTVEPTWEVLNLKGILDLGRVIQSQIVDYGDWIIEDPVRLLVRMATGYPSIWERVATYENDFGWMGRMYYAGEPISAADIVLRLQNILRHDCASRLAHIEARREEQLAERRRAIECIDDPEAQRLADIVASYIYLRSERLDVFFIAHERVIEALRAAGRALGLARPDDIIFLDWREISRALREGSSPAELRACVDARRNGFELVAVAGAIEWIPRAVSPQTQEAVRLPASDDDVAGVTACGGRVRGQVRLVLTDQDMVDMIPGEILVTASTTPSLMLAVEKAAGIVTDEGGMLCHAAIVSREFDIPCVIGTDDATRRLRTGDTVDMSASEGRVKIVSRAQPSAKQ
jgi:phosphohistidine swiveling domain-containing protein